ncbi:MAG: hypothetical protein NT072_03560 [Deltaproteobacteria bacterium]|nr:hypothetical protein [Deltaproteobacteria bacterium]
MKRCYRCGHEFDDTRQTGREEVCPGCGRDVHVCRNCAFYDSAAYNQCHEPQAERVLDKERSNFCDFFRFGSGGPRGKETEPARDVKEKLGALFKK